MIANRKSALTKVAVALVAASLAFCTLIVVVDVGIQHTPYDTTDSAGRRMGFNDPLSAEHWVLIVANFRIGNLLAPDYAYTGFLLAMHGVAIGWLLRFGFAGGRSPNWFFALQGLLFPVGWIGFLAWPSMIRWLVNGTFDREAIIDVPFIAVTAQSVWVAVSMTLFAIGWRASRRGPGSVPDSTKNRLPAA